jgi:hypothetical protein
VGVSDLRATLMCKFDFDAWAVLARTDPDKFEQQRRAILESYISNSRNIRRLRGLQWTIDMERVRARTPMKSCLRLSALMWDAFTNLNNALNAAEEYCPSANVTSHSAKNLMFVQVLPEHKPHK